MHTAPILIVRVYRRGVQIGEVGYHGYATQRFGVCAEPEGLNLNFPFPAPPWPGESIR